MRREWTIISPNKVPIVLHIREFFSAFFSYQHKFILRESIQLLPFYIHIVITCNTILINYIKCMFIRYMYVDEEVWEQYHDMVN